MTTSVQTVSGNKADQQQLDSTNPTTGKIVGSVPIVDAAGVRLAMSAARHAATAWSALSFTERRDQLLKWRREIARRLDDYVDLIHEENGKPRGDAISEVWAALYHLTDVACQAREVLAPRKVSSGLMSNMASTLSYQPFGVVGVIGPWNMPLFTPMGSIASALAAGNTVVFKPSELTPLVGQLMAETAADAIDIPDVLVTVTGDGTTGAALAKSGVDKLSFTGSANTGKKVMAAAAENLTPVVMELGGKDPMIVAADADLDSAAKHAVYGAFALTGQACISVERCYVASEIYDEFVDRVVHETSKLRASGDSDAHMGAITRPQQVAFIRDQIQDAVDKGARVLRGGVDGIDGNFIQPTVLVDVDERMKIMRDETFGPVLPIVKVADAEDGLRRANDTKYGLGSSIFGQRGVRKLAKRFRAGMTTINSVWAYALIPALPFGGRGLSGFGRIHGAEGLKEFSMLRSTVEERFALPINALNFQENPAKAYDQFYSLTKQMYGGGVIDRLGSVWRRLTG